MRKKLTEVAIAAGAIPASASVTVTADTWDAAWKINDLVTRIETLNKLAHSPGNYNFTGITPSGPAGNAMGGRIFPGAAGGTRMGGPHLVGELGPEIFWPDSAGTIVTAEKTKQMLSSSSGGGAAVFNININTVAGDPVAIERVVVDAIARAHRRGATALVP
jgi:phage-related minor tail protein